MEAEPRRMHPSWRAGAKTGTLGGRGRVPSHWPPGQPPLCAQEEVTYPGSQRVCDKAEPSFQPQIRAMEEHCFWGMCNMAGSLGQFSPRWSSIKKQVWRMPLLPGSLPSLKALSFPTCFMSSLSLGCTANVSPGDGIYMCEC